MRKPEISVIMPVYNAGEYIWEAIQSILDQTFYDFEFIIIDDGSSDNSNEILRSFNDNRISIISHSLNKGNYPSRNEGIRIAKGKYICVMDADDVALNTRLERQYLFMEQNPEIGLAGSGFRYYGKELDIFREFDYERIKVILLRNNCFIHPTLIIRHDLLLKHQLFYNEKYYYAADYDLIVRASRFFQVTNINETLLLYRMHKNQITSRYRAKQAEYADEISIDQLKHEGIYPDHDEIGLHLSLLKGVPLSFENAPKLKNWIEKLLKFSYRHYDQEIFKSFLEALYSYQSFCWTMADDYLKIPARITKKHKLTEFEILIPVRVDSSQRMENILAVIKFINQNFNVPIRILESNSTASLNFFSDYKNVTYLFDADKNLICNK
jgi:glycosyltransferase involved in cell wall biosynthesis